MSRLTRKNKSTSASRTRATRGSEEREAEERHLRSASRSFLFVSSRRVLPSCCCCCCWQWTTTAAAAAESAATSHGVNALTSGPGSKMHTRATNLPPA
ncbi:hypothetical protein EAG_14827 [Camponotus floridanus]|uniref:Uncharacterized protein n=1 Tax=Camponotus floridanus TaxID=104421 RepID=E2A9D9_CAMFO|nr:hypothetical protein EAG_14827 [Camponotus floridanus]